MKTGMFIPVLPTFQFMRLSVLTERDIQPTRTISTSKACFYLIFDTGLDKLLVIIINSKAYKLLKFKHKLSGGGTGY